MSNSQFYYLFSDTKNKFISYQVIKETIIKIKAENKLKNKK